MADEKFGDLGISALKGLKTLVDENARLKRIAADFKQIVLRKSSRGCQTVRAGSRACRLALLRSSV